VNGAPHFTEAACGHPDGRRLIKKYQASAGGKSRHARAQRAIAADVFNVTVDRWWALAKPLALLRIAPSQNIENNPMQSNRGPMAWMFHPSKTF
jgi:hypothetical protein